MNNNEDFTSNEREAQIPHTLWHSEAHRIYQGENRLCAFIGDRSSVEQDVERAARAVACVNACVSIPNSELESGLIQRLYAEHKAPRPKIVCLCGSTRFMEAFQEANLLETLAGNIVLSVGCNTKSDSDLLKAGELTEGVKSQLDALHKRKIDLADEILVLNVGGYIGDSTRSEIAHAVAHNKAVRWLEPPTTQTLDINELTSDLKGANNA